MRLTHIFHGRMGALFRFIGGSEFFICIPLGSYLFFFFFFFNGVPNLKKVGVKKFRPTDFGNKNFTTTPTHHHHRTLPPKQAKIVLKSVFFQQFNTLWPSCDSIHFGHHKFYDPLIFLSKNS